MDNKFFSDDEFTRISKYTNSRSVVELLEKFGGDIDKLKAYVKWLYKYGGTGSKIGGGGGGSSANWSLNIKLNGEKIEPTKLIKKDANNTLEISIARPGSSSYKVTVEYEKNNSGKRIQLGTTVLDALKNKYVLNISMQENGTLYINATNNDDVDDWNEYKCDCIVNSYKLALSFIKNDNTKYIIPNNILSLSEISNGLKLRIEHNTYINPKDADQKSITLSVDITSPKNNWNKTYNLGEYALNTENNNYYTDINLYDIYDLSNTEDNNIFGTYFFNVTLTYFYGGAHEVHESSRIILIPHDTLFLLVQPKDPNANIFTEQQTNPSYAFNNRNVTLLLTPYNPENGKTHLTVLLNGRELNSTLNSFETVQKTFTCMNSKDGIFENEIVFKLFNESKTKSYEITYYIYLNQDSNIISWFDKDIISNRYSFLYLDNAVTDGESNVLSDQRNLYLDEIRKLQLNNQGPLLLNYVNNNAVTIYHNNNKYTNAQDILISFGIQYNAAARQDKEIIKILFSNHSKYIHIFQNKAIMNDGNTEGTEIFIPMTENYNVDLPENYHLLNIFIHKDKTLNKYELVFYIDGFLENAYLESFASNNLNNTIGMEIEDIIFYEGNYSINFIDVVYAINNAGQLNDNDILQYFYCYKSKCDQDAYTSEIIDFKSFTDIYNKFIEKDLYINDKVSNTVYQLDDTENITSFYSNLKLSSNTDDTYNYGAPILLVSFNNYHNSDEINTEFFDKLFLHHYDEKTDSLSESTPINNVKITWINNAYDIRKCNASYTFKLQGTSTGKFKSKNFDLTIQSNHENYTALFTPNFIPNESSTDTIKTNDDFLSFLPEQTFTCKADAVDSTHSNNTSIGLFINKHTNQFNDAQSMQSESMFKYKKYIKNCLYGFPILVFFEFITDENIPNEYYYMGIYNFNLGRKSYINLGYYNFNDIFNNLHLYSNDVNSINNEVVDLFEKYNEEYIYKGFNEFEILTEKYHTIENENNAKTGLTIAEIQGGETYFDFSQFDETILFKAFNKERMFGDYFSSKGETIENFERHKIKDFVTGVSLIGGKLFENLDKYFSNNVDDLYGYKYGYGAHYINNYGMHTTLKSINSVPNYKHQVKLTMTPEGEIKYVWDPTTINTDEYYNNSNFTTFFKNFIGVKPIDDETTILKYDQSISDKHNKYVNLLDYTSLVEYFTICMAFGLVDSVRKNLNIKSFSMYGPFYIAFYDMDTALSRDNGGGYVSPFAFSDYWTSAKSSSDSNINIIYRDFYPLKSLIAADSSEYDPTIQSKIADLTQLQNTPAGYDVPSSYLFAIAKYSQLFYNAQSLNINSGYNTSPSYLWFTFRKDKNSPLGSADMFLNNYFLKNSNNINKTLFNLNYRFKFLQKVNDGSFMFNNQDLKPFHGRGINSLRYWLTKRFHILDAYFNIESNEIPYQKYNSAEDKWTSIQVGSGNNISNLRDPEFNKIVNSDINTKTSNDDIEIKKSMFEESSYDGANRFTTIKALPYSPMLFIYQNSSEEFICIDSDTEYTFKGDPLLKDSNMPLYYYGSQNWTYAQNLAPFIGQDFSLSLNNRFLTNINIGTGRLDALSLYNMQSLEEILITGSNKNATITLDNSDAGNLTDNNNDFNSLKTINISGTGCLLKAKELNVTKILMANMTGQINQQTGEQTAQHEIVDCQNLIDVTLDNAKANKLYISPVWKNTNTINNCYIENLTLANLLHDNLELNINNTVNDSSLKTLNISGYTHIYVKNCPNLSTLVINEGKYKVKSLIIEQCNNVAITINEDEYDNTNKCINLSSLTELEEISFKETIGFNKIILPYKENIKLKAEAFYNTDIQYIDFIDRSSSNTIINQANLPTLILLDNNNDADRKAATFKDSPFTLMTDDTGYNLKFKVLDNKFTSLAECFYKTENNSNHKTTNALTYYNVEQFIRNLGNQNKVISFKKAFSGQKNIIATYNPVTGNILNGDIAVNQYNIRESDENNYTKITETINLDNYHNLEDISEMFDGTTINFVDNKFFGNSYNGCASEVSVFNLLNFMNNTKLLYMHKDSLKFIKFKIQRFLFTGKEYEGSRDRASNGIILYDSNRQISDKNTAGLLTFNINIHNFLFSDPSQDDECELNENGIKCPKKSQIYDILRFKFSAKSTMDFNNLFTENESSLKNILYSLGGLNFSSTDLNVLNTENFNIRSLSNLERLTGSFTSTIIDFANRKKVVLDKCVDICNFFDWDNENQYSSIMYHYYTDTGGENSAFSFYKKVDFSEIDLNDPNNKWNKMWNGIANLHKDSLGYNRIAIDHLLQLCQFIYPQPEYLTNISNNFINFDNINKENLNNALNQITLKIPQIDNLVVDTAEYLFYRSTAYLKKNNGDYDEVGILLNNDSLSVLSQTQGDHKLTNIDNMFSYCIFNGNYRYPLCKNLLSTLSNLISANDLFSYSYIYGENKTYYIDEDLNINNSKEVYYKYKLNVSTTIQNSANLGPSNYILDSRIYTNAISLEQNAIMTAGYEFIPSEFFKSNKQLQSINKIFYTSDFEGYINENLFNESERLININNIIGNCKILPQLYHNFNNSDIIDKIHNSVINNERILKAYVFLPDNLFKNTNITDFLGLFTFNILVSDDRKYRLYLMANNTTLVQDKNYPIGYVDLNFKYNKTILNKQNINYYYQFDCSTNAWCLLDDYYKYNTNHLRILSKIQDANRYLRETNIGNPSQYPIQYIHAPLPYTPVINLCINDEGNNTYSEGISYNMGLHISVRHQLENRVNSSIGSVKSFLLDKNLSCLYYGYIFKKGTVISSIDDFIEAGTNIGVISYGYITKSPAASAISNDFFIYRQLSRNIKLPQIAIMTEFTGNTYDTPVMWCRGRKYSYDAQLYPKQYRSGFIFVNENNNHTVLHNESDLWGSSPTLKRKMNVFYASLFDDTSANISNTTTDYLYKDHNNKTLYSKSKNNTTLNEFKQEVKELVYKNYLLIFNRWIYDKKVTTSPNTTLTGHLRVYADFIITNASVPTLKTNPTVTIEGNTRTLTYGQSSTQNLYYIGDLYPDYIIEITTNAKGDLNIQNSTDIIQDSENNFDYIH